MNPDGPDRSRREFLKLSALFSLGGALPLLESLRARAAAEPDAPVRIGYLPITDAAPLLVAHHNGLFEAEGLKVDPPVLLRGWAQLIEAFLAGQVNVVHLLSPMAVWARFGGRAPAKVVAWNHINGSALTVAPTVNRVEDLGGKTVAVPFWYSLHNVVLQHLLRARGLTPVTGGRATVAARDVKLVVMPPADMPPALASQQIAGYIVAEPFNAAAEQLGIGKILRFTGDVWRNHACCVVFMHERDLEERSDWSQHVVNALVNAQLWTLENRAAAAALLSKTGAHRYTPHETPVLARVLKLAPEEWRRYVDSGAIRHPEWEAPRIGFQPYPFPSYTELLVRELQKTQVEGDTRFLAELDPARAARELVDDRFVKRGLARVGGLTRFGLPEQFARQEILVE